MKRYVSAAKAAPHRELPSLVNREFTGYCEVKDGSVVRSHGSSAPHIRLRYLTDRSAYQVVYRVASDAVQALEGSADATPFTSRSDGYDAIVKAIDEQIVPDFSDSDALGLNGTVIDDIEPMSLNDGYYAIFGRAYIDYNWYYEDNYLMLTHYDVDMNVEPASSKVAETFMTGKAK